MYDNLEKICLSSDSFGLMETATHLFVHPGNWLFLTLHCMSYTPYSQTGHNGTNDPLSMLIFPPNKPECGRSFPVTSSVFFLSIFSGPAVHHFNSSTSTKRHWWRVECSPSTVITQRASSRSILWDPLWCRAGICRLVNQWTSAWLGRPTPTIPMWVLSKDKGIHWRLAVKSLTGTLNFANPPDLVCGTFV